jgi:hypothetical protein
VSERLSPSEELAALALLEEALEVRPGDPRAHVYAAADLSEAVRERALRLLSASETSSASVRTGGATDHGRDLADETVPERIGTYRILRVLGRGGMGTVYQAERADADFTHVAAVKVIKPGILSDGMIERFRRERRILASLRHPNIARLYDGGQTAGGAPYIVMELVDGISLSRWIESAVPPLGQRLALIEQVCGAVEFAHQNLVIHRDLTPGNVLVTERGEAKLIDFGIARPHEDDQPAPPQSPLSRLSLTPGFAAPERVAGAPVSTLVDIYSLGRLLNAVVEGFDEPELRAIAARAASDDPALRYPSAALMAQDIANWRRGMAIAAYSSAPSYRARKFVARHRLPASLGALAALVLVAGLLLVSHAYREADRARQSAEQRFDEVRALSKFLLFDLYDQLEDVPGTTAALNAIADRARHYLDALSSSEGASSEVRLEAALAYKRLSDVLGTPIAANLGRREEAGEALEVAIAQLRDLHAAAPADAAIAQGLAEALYSKAVFAFIALDDSEMARTAASESARLYRQLAERPGAPEQLSRNMIDAEIEAALPLAWIGRGSEAASELRATLATTERHIARFGRTGANLALLARAESSLAETLGKLGDTGEADYADALVYADRAVATYGEYAGTADKQDGAERSRAISLFKRSLIHYAMERYAPALADLDRAEAIVAALASRDADDAEIARIHSAILEQQAITLAYGGRSAEAMQVARRSLARKRTAALEEPGSHGLQRDYGSNLLIVGEVAEIGRNRPEACRLYREGERVYRALERDNGLSEYDRDVVLADLSESLARTC